MSLNLHSDIINRVKKTWEYLRPSGTPHLQPRKADHLVKMNLPPLMGRRDAAYDRAREFINRDLFALDELGRRRVYCAISSLLKSASDDTEAMLITLSSPDTELREKKMLHLLLMMYNIAQSLVNFAELEDDLFCDESSPLRDLDIAPNENELARNEKLLSEAEISVVNQMRSYFERTQTRINRYRGYTGKSFSASNASRYNKAYEAYSKLYGELVPETPPAA